MQIITDKISSAVFFENRIAFRQWLKANHKNEKALLVGFIKTIAGRRSMTWSESVEEALCFGWIDGVRKSIDDSRYFIRFSVRKQISIWSNVNIKKAEYLIKEGKMEPAGLEAFQKRNETSSGIYSYEKTGTVFSDDIRNHFKSDKAAWEYFERQSPSYKNKATYWIMNAKNGIIRMARLKRLMNSCSNFRRL